MLGHDGCELCPARPITAAHDRGGDGGAVRPGVGQGGEPAARAVWGQWRLAVRHRYGAVPSRKPDGGHRLQALQPLRPHVGADPWTVPSGSRRRGQRQAFGPVPLGTERTLGQGGIELAIHRSRGEPHPGAVLSSAVIGVPARWNGSIRTADIDAAFATIRERVGRCFRGAIRSPAAACSASVADPVGNRFGLGGPRQAACRKADDHEPDADEPPRR